jgi:hypothetical protein
MARPGTGQYGWADDPTEKLHPAPRPADAELALGIQLGSAGGHRFCRGGLRDLGYVQNATSIRSL